MKPFIVDVHKWFGTNYEVGCEQFQAIPDKTSYLTLLQSLTSSEVDWEQGTSLLKKFSPHLIDEIQGLGDQMGLSYQEAFRYFSGYIEHLTNEQALPFSSMKGYIKESEGAKP